MLWQSSRRLGLIVMLLGAAAIFFFTAAPDKEKPEKITVGNITWNNTSGSFDVEISLQTNLAAEAVREGHTLTTTLDVTDSRSGEPLARLGPQTDPVVIDTSAPPSRGMVALEPQSIPWESRGTFTGTVEVSGDTQLKRADGEPVASIHFVIITDLSN